MNFETAASPVSIQHHGSMPHSTSSKGLPKVSSITRNRDSFICGKIDIGVLDVSTDYGAGERLDDGARCLRFASAALTIDSILSPTPANNAEMALPQQALPEKPQPEKPQPEKPQPEKPLPQEPLPQKVAAPPVEAPRKNTGREVASSASKEEESVTSLRIKSLIELFDNESVGSSVDGIRDSGNVFVTETPTRPVMELVAMFDENSDPSEKSAENELKKSSPERGSEEFDRKEPIQSFPEVEYVETEVVSETEIEQVDSRDIETNMHITPLNTQEIDDAIEDIGMNRTTSQRKGRLSALMSPLTPVRNMFSALKNLKSPRAKQANSSETLESGPANEADNSFSPRDSERVRSGKERKSPNIFRKIPAIMQFSPRKAKETRTQQHENARSSDSSLHIDVDSARKRRRSIFDTLEPFKYY